MKKGNTRRYDHKTPERLFSEKKKVKPKRGAGLLTHKCGKKEKEVLNENGHETDDDKKSDALFKNQSFNQMHNQIDQYV
jgi:hypothetical protein